MLIFVSIYEEDAAIEHTGSMGTIAIQIKEHFVCKSSFFVLSHKMLISIEIPFIFSIFLHNQLRRALFRMK